MTIKDVSEKFDLSKDTLRFYEKKGLIGPVKKTNSGIRDYDKEDLARIEFIKCMRNAGLPVDVLKRYINLFDEGIKTRKERQKILEEQRDVLKEKLDDMKKAYETLNYKIELYKSGKLEDYLKKSKRK